MQETNDRLIENFLKNGKTDIPDNGFSRRVMKHLPHHTPLVARLWTAGCFTLTAILFIVLDGFNQIGQALLDIFNTQILEEAYNQLDMRTLVIAGIVLLYLTYRKIASWA